MRILVCGGRNYTNKDRVYEVLCDLAEVDDNNWLGKDVTIIHGGATGADQFADDWAVTYWKEILVYPARWDIYGNAAGPIRNQLMLDEGKPDLVVAFPGGKGTQDMISRALKANIPVRVINAG